MRTTIAKSKKEMAQMAKAKKAPPPKPLNFSQALKVMKKLFGAKARIWHNNRDKVEVGLQEGNERVILLVGTDFSDVVKKAKEEVAGMAKRA